MSSSFREQQVSSMKVEGDDLLTVPEAAAALRLKPSTMRAWILQRRIQYAKLGGKVLLRRCDLERLLATSLVPARAKPGTA
jgi:excisionase family DNA binding protein